MVLHTRRRFLQAATAATAGVAGCAGLTGDDEQVSRSVSERESNAQHDDAETDPPLVLLRTTAKQPAIRMADGENDDPDRERLGHPPSRFSHTVVGSESAADELTVADHVDDDPVTPFVAETDFDGESLYLETIRVEECFRLELCTISWAPDDVHTDYVRKLRPYDERCATDTYAFESRLVRIPAALDEESVNSFGSSIGGSGECGAPRPHGVAGDRAERTATSTPTATPEDAAAGSPTGGAE